MLFEHIWSNLESLQKNQKINRINLIQANLLHEINERTAIQLRSGVTELLESDEARVRIAENTVSVSELAKN